MEKNAYKNADLIVVPSGEHKKFIEEKETCPREKRRWSIIG